MDPYAIDAGAGVGAARGAVSTVFGKLYLDFQKFAFSNSVVVSATGFSIGVATKEVIENVITLAVLPLMRWVGQSSGISKRVPKVAAKLGWYTFVFVLTIVLTFVLLEYLLNRTILGMRTVVKEQEFNEYIKSKSEAKHNTIIPITAQQIDKAGKEQDLEAHLIQRQERMTDFALMRSAEQE